MNSKNNLKKFSLTVHHRFKILQFNMKIIWYIREKKCLLSTKNKTKQIIVAQKKFSETTFLVFENYSGN